MKISKSKLNRIIQEEVVKVLSSVVNGKISHNGLREQVTDMPLTRPEEVVDKATADSVLITVTDAWGAEMRSELDGYGPPDFVQQSPLVEGTKVQYQVIWKFEGRGPELTGLDIVAAGPGTERPDLTEYVKSKFIQYYQGVPGPEAPAGSFGQGNGTMMSGYRVSEIYMAALNFTGASLRTYTSGTQLVASDLVPVGHETEEEAEAAGAVIQYDAEEVTP